MAKQKVLLLGVTGETGREIVKGLLEDGNFDITCIVRSPSAKKPFVQDISSQGVKLVIEEITDNVESLTKAFKGYDTVIDAFSFASPNSVRFAIVDAAAKAGINRFVPCVFATICPPGGVMALRDSKEEVFQRIWYHHLPYTIIDVGLWHQISVPRVPSGKLDNFLIAPKNQIFEAQGRVGEVKSMLSDKRDIGKWVAKIIGDERTLNKKVFACSDVLSQKEVVDIVERKSGEKIELTTVSEKEALERLENAREAAAKNPEDWWGSFVARAQAEYDNSQFIRGDNTPEIGNYLGYLDARELYPDVQTIGFEDLVGELLEGKGQKPYEKGLAAGRE